MNEDHSVMQ